MAEERIVEMHQMKTRELMDVLDTAPGARRQPLKFRITNGGVDLADPPIEPPVVAPWESTRCRCCGRLLCKNTRDALKPECVIEIKCGDCKTLNYLMGRPDAI